MQLKVGLFLIGVIVSFSTAGTTVQAQPPNVILILADDQGYGDWGFRGTHQYLKTPHMDQLSEDGLFLTDFHVNVLCGPSRAALMSGRDAFSVRCWQGRHHLRADVPTLGSVFKDNGYQTAMFGKWHMGDNYPYRPIDRGFDESLQIVNGMVTTANDYPTGANKDYMDPYLKKNDVWTPYSGYTTDIWFGEAIKYIEAHQKKPFFIYLAPEAPHAPHISKKEDLAGLEGIEFEGAGNPRHNNQVRQFYGQIQGIDRNLGVLRKKLKSLGLEDNTIIIYLGDNGSAMASSIASNAGFHDESGLKNEEGTFINAGLRGGKANSFDGGHRVPFFIYWKNGGLVGGKLIEELTCHMDMLPTLIDLCKLTPPDNLSSSKWDGISLNDLLQNPQEVTLPARSIYTGYSTSQNPPGGPGGPSCMKKFRLSYNNGHFSNVSSDVSQSTNLGRNVEFRKEKLQMQSDAKARHAEYAETVYPFHDRIYIGSPKANPTLLNGADWKNGKALAWLSNVGNPIGFNGDWLLKTEQGGSYRIDLYRWHPLQKKGLRDGSKALDIQQARLTIPEINFDQTLEISDGSTPFVSFQLKLPKDKELTLRSSFISGEGAEICGAPMANIQWLSQ